MTVKIVCCKGKNFVEHEHYTIAFKCSCCGKIKYEIKEGVLQNDF